MFGGLYNETQAGLNMHPGRCSTPFLSYYVGVQWQICEPHSATRAILGRELWQSSLSTTVVNTPWLKKRTVQTIQDQVRYVAKTEWLEYCHFGFRAKS